MMAASILVLSLCACKKDTGSVSYSVDESHYAFSADARESLERIRKGVGDGSEASQESSDTLCSVAYLGAADTSECFISSNQELYREILDSNGYSSQYAFLSEISSFDIFESVTGTELFCIVPPSQSKNVSIRIAEENLNPDYLYPDDSVQASVDHGSPDEEGTCLMYSRNNSDPVIICVNSEDSSSEAHVIITLANDEIISFSPKLRQSDSRLELQDGMMDFSLYPSYAEASDFIGNWICSYVEDDLENKRSVFFNFGSEEYGSSVFCGYSALEGVFAEMNLFTFSGTWSVSQVTMDNYEKGCVVLDLVSSGGAYQDAGAPVHSVSSVLAITEVPNDPNAIAIRCVDGEPILPGTLYKTLIFERLQ